MPAPSPRSSTSPAADPPPAAPTARPELALLLRACRDACGATPGREGDAAEFRAVVAAVTDWGWLLAAAARNAVTPLLYRGLAALPAAVPSDVLALARARFDENALRNLELTSHLVDVLGRLERDGVGALPVKGPVLALSAYGDIALRQFADLDIVIRRRDLARAGHVLAAAGYQPATRLERGPEAALVGSDYHRPYVNDATRVTLELHWGLGRGSFGRFLDDRWAWRNARRVSLLGREVATLSWEALLVYLCMHGSKHLWSRLAWVCDVAAVLRAATSLDWTEVSRLAADAGARRMVALGLLLAHDLLGAEPPAAAPDGRGDPITVALAAEVCGAMFDGRRRPMVDVMAWQCRVRDRLADRISYCVHILTAPHLADVTAVSLPTRLRGLYYLFRPARLLARSARGSRL